MKRNLKIFLLLISLISFCLISPETFKYRATAVPNSIDRSKFDFSTAVARRLKPSRATAVPNSIHKS